MTITTTNLTGKVFLPNGSVPIDGKVIFELTSWDREENEAVFVSGPYITDIGVNGDIDIDLFTSSEGVNSVSYRMSVTYRDPIYHDHVLNQTKTEYFGYFSLLGPGPYKLSNLEIVSEYIHNSFDLYAEFLAGNQIVIAKSDEASAAAIAAAVSAAEADASAIAAAADAGGIAASVDLATTKASEANASAISAAASAVEASDSAILAATDANEADASAIAAAASADEASASASTATTKAGEASASASTATTKASEANASAIAANASASTATTKANEANASAGVATGKADEASASAIAASASAGAASTSASTATTKAGEANASAISATASAGTATTKASEASASAGVATTKANEASASSASAAISADEAAADAVSAAASAAAVAADIMRFVEDVATLVADTDFTYTAAQPGTVVSGDTIVVKKELFSYVVAASGASNHHLTTAGGVKLYVQPDNDGFYPIDAFNPGATDATAAYEFITANCGSLQFGPKEYFLTNAATGILAKHVRGIRGATTLTAKAATSASPLLIEVASKSNVIFEGLNFNGNEANITIDQFRNVVTVYQCTNIRFKYCKWYDCEGIAVIFSGGTRNKLFECEFSNCGTRNDDTADTADRRAAAVYTGSTYGEVTKCHFDNVGLDMISIATSSHYFKVTGCIGLENDAGGFYFSTSDFGIISDCSVSNAATNTDGGNGFDIGFCDNLSISNCQAYSCGAAGIQIADSKYVTVNGCITKNNWKGGTSLHRGGLTISSTTPGSVKDMLITGLISFDNQGAANVTQNYAIGVRTSGGGTFTNVRLGADCILRGYHTTGGAEDDTFRIQDDTKIWQQIDCDPEAGKVLIKRPSGTLDVDFTAESGAVNFDLTATSTAVMNLTGTYLAVGFTDTDAGADLKKVIFTNSAGAYAFFKADDAGAFVNNMYRVVMNTTGANSHVFNLGATSAFEIASSYVRPGVDNARDLGMASFRWREVFSANGTINTSDARKKTPVRKMTKAEISAAQELSEEIGVFQFLEAVDEKGDAARQHIGMTVQRAIEIMKSHKLDPAAYGFICYDKWEAVPAEYDKEGNQVSEPLEAGDIYSFRPDQLALFIARGQAARLSQIEEKLSKLK